MHCLFQYVSVNGNQKKIREGDKDFSWWTYIYSSDKFQEGTLPTKQDVIDRVLSEDHFFSINAARAVAA